ncbi:7TM diverse intracellular signaling domain-containing protein [Dinghuibacter silviterrae]|uniref:Signal transduction histidine kinase n=1 Tax=Dinghuibacter silviterrae TaxID=1539049 RepID=A0A4R8DHL7_9BACT|nr:7TM diverse intracellular signaling domain-containing protein [Dinghuibacter silviterrae]TDW96948.1 signal transduction histidine kinase [Dinghuibacter silviterrae]
MRRSLTILLALTFPLGVAAQLPLRTFGLRGALEADSMTVCRIDTGLDLAAAAGGRFSPGREAIMSWLERPGRERIRGSSEPAGRRSASRGQTLWLKFSLRNTTDTVLTFFVYCGDLDYVDAWIAGRDTLHSAAGVLQRVPPGSTPAQRYFSAIPLHLAPHEQGVAFFAIRQVNSGAGLDGVSLYAPAALDAAWAGANTADQGYYVFEWLFQGFLLCQVLYVLFQWLIVRRKEYLYYFCYLVALTLYFLSKFESFLGVELLFSRLPLLKVYLSKTLLIFPYFLYLRFVRSFLDIPHRYTALNKWIVWVEYFLLGYTVFDLVLIAVTFDPRLQAEFFTYVLLALFLLSTSFIVYLFRHRETLIYYILTGSLCVAVGNILGQVFTYVEFYHHINLGIDHILVFPQTGILLEILCFTAGLGHKTLLAEKEKLRSQAKLMHIRGQVAQDLHDDIGSTLSSISILSDLALRGGQTQETVSEIKDSAILLMERMDDLVWSIHPRNDSLEHLLMRVRHFATTLFEAKGIEYDISIQKDIGEVRLPMDFRQHVYLVLKEAINNLVKYAGAQQAYIRVGFDARHLELSVRDDGRGFDTTQSRKGNGLEGMRKRAEMMGATLTIVSEPGAGTEVMLQVKL